MKITCGACGAKLNIPDDKLPSKKTKGKCPKCSQAIVIDPGGAAKPAAQAGAPQAPSPAMGAAQPPEPPPKMVKTCPFCAEEINFDAIKCKHCGEFLDGRNVAPAVSAAQPEDEGDEGLPEDYKGHEYGKIWNPNVAASLSLFLTPAFGAFLHMMNWKALGEPGQARKSKIWFITALVLPYLAIPAELESRQSGGVILKLIFVLLLLWYFISARKQARYVKEVLDNDYPRRGFIIPFALGILAVGAYFVVLGAIVASMAG
jgi:predicted Zn finger-like uncharacterized protein